MDTVTRFIFEDLDIRGALIHLGPAWRSMHHGRNYAPVTQSLLGQICAITAMFGSNLKSNEKISFQMQGHGALRLLVVECRSEDGELRLRGMAKAPADLAEAPIQELLDDGQLVLTLQNDATERPYQSIVPLEGDSVAQVFEHYLAQSEQAPARLFLMADAAHACGLFLQKLPDADLRDADGWNRITHLASTVKNEELTLPAETILGMLFPEENLRVFPPNPAVYHSPRNEEKVLATLKSLGQAELKSILAEHGEIVMHDDIGNHEYRFGAEILAELFPEIAPQKPTLH